MKNANATFRQGFLKITLCLTCCIFSFSSFSQTKWSLQKCIQHAKENSLTLKQAEYGIQLAALTDKQNRLNRLPTVNGSSSSGFQFGLNVDPTTNTLRNQRIGFNSFGVNGSVPIYSGGQLNNAIRQGKYDLSAAKAYAAFAFNNMALNIANAYLQILMAEEQLANAQKRKALSEQQLTQTDKLINAGTLPANDRLEVLAQIARDEQTIITSQNLIDINYLNLKEFMQLDPSTDMEIEKPDVDAPTDMDANLMSFNTVYSTAVNNQPQVIRDENNLKSAEVGVDLARGAMLPSLLLFAGMDTRWSSAAKVVDQVTEFRNTQTFYFGDDPIEIGYDDVDVTLKDQPYFDQLEKNFGQNVGVQLRVPIYNNNSNAINVERAKVGILSAKLQADLTKQQLKVDVQNAIASARAAHRSYEAAQKTLEAANAAFQNAETQYELGAINTFQYTTARNTKDMAEIDLIVAKYDYIFRTKIIDFYLGKEIKMD